MGNSKIKFTCFLRYKEVNFNVYSKFIATFKNFDKIFERAKNIGMSNQ